MAPTASLTGMLAPGRCGASQGRREPQRGPAPAGKGGFPPWPGPVGASRLLQLSPHLGPVTLATPIKVPFPVGTAAGVICLDAPLTHLNSIPGKPEALLHRIALWGAPVTGVRRSNTQPCLARPACAAGPGRAGVEGLAAMGAWVGPRSHPAGPKVAPTVPGGLKIPQEQIAEACGRCRGAQPRPQSPRPPLSKGRRWPRVGDWVSPDTREGLCCRAPPPTARSPCPPPH